MMNSTVSEETRQSMTELNDLISEVDDVAQRKFIIVMRTISAELLQTTTDNRKAIEIIGAKMDKHLENYRVQSAELLTWKNQGLGMWKVLSIVFVAAQGLLGYGFNYVVDKANTMEQSIAELRTEVKATKLDISALTNSMHTIKDTVATTPDTKPRQRR